MTLDWRDGGYWLDGEPVDHARVIAWRDRQVAAWERELAELARDLLGDGATAAIEFPLERIDGFANRFLRRVGEIVSDAYVSARGGVGRVTAAGWRTLAGLVATQDRFARGFVADLRAGQLSVDQAAARASLYGGAAVSAWEHGHAGLRGFDPPAVPGEGCAGLTNCRCFWEIAEFPDRIEATWIAVGDRNTCQVCRDRASEWAPLVQAR